MALRDEIQPDARGKVRELYDLGDSLLFVASDRISAFDYVLEDSIPFKGEILTRMSLFWFALLADVTPNHLISADAASLPTRFAPFASELAGRFMLVKKARMFPVECIVRGYLAGSGLKEYEQNGTVCGIELPASLTNSSRLPHALYTPSTKAELGSHDENVTFAQTEDMLGPQDAAALRERALAVYQAAHDYALSRGIIIADTKFEFGRVGNEVVLADEVLTPDSSRFWPLAAYQPGESQTSFDKQFVRDWLIANWDMQSPPPRLPADIIEATSQKYIQAFELLTGETFEPMAAKAGLSPLPQSGIVE
ncbi:MAG: phosphoribosylaminoimidazolesuccinocarboxamide synthase [Coriobacteriales bacterium]|jgi:phosphoribosylaminoimidazole-succinocarboxamide synthase|nr:phosphoribosylaminoimidazolesuccinocarboxamide synthase [Coriobacteriales bacterium]